MTAPDVVFARFVDANPVPDVTELERLRPELTESPRFEPAGIDEPATLTRLQPPRRAWLVAAALLSVAVIAGVVLAWPSQPGVQVAAGRSEEGTPDVAESPSGDAAQPGSSEDALRRDAVVAVEAWIVALDAGEIDRVLALSGDTARSDADRRVHEWVVGWARAGLPIEVTGCVVESVTGSIVRVECDAHLTDPVAQAVGVADLVAPFDYRDGLVTWQPYKGGDLTQVNNAYASYLRTFHSAAHEARCSPAAYEPGTVIASGGLALTADCAELAAPLSEDVARWVTAGMPEGQP